MNVVYFEDGPTEQLLPLTWLRPAFSLRCGTDLLIDKVRQHTHSAITRLILRPLLQEVAPAQVNLDPINQQQGWCLLSARTLITGDVQLPPPGVAWQSNGFLVAVGVRQEDVNTFDYDSFTTPQRIDDWLRHFRIEHAPPQVRLVDYPWVLPLCNEEELQRQLTDLGTHEGFIHPGAHLVHPEQIRIEHGAVIKPGAVLDADNGPIHIAANAQIEANAVVQGPSYIGLKSIVRPGATIRPGTTIGPVCKVGGEIEASIFQGYANKQHDGFLGHSFVSSWVNLGADTVTSDLKNTYGTIRMLINGVGVETGEHFVGSIIGDHAKTGIGTILPTGCVIGVAANVFTQGAVPKFVPSFAWLTDKGMTPCQVEKIVQIARVVMGRRDIELSAPETRLLERIAVEARQTEAPGWTA